VALIAGGLMFMRRREPRERSVIDDSAPPDFSTADFARSGAPTCCRLSAWGHAVPRHC
jgi:hypothetical protein